MKRVIVAALRPVVLLLVIEAATVLLVRVAPGYFMDATALDPRLSERAHRIMQSEQQASAGAIMDGLGEDLALLRGRLGVSRYYRVPVSSLLAPRWAVTLRLLGGSLAFSWLLAIAVAIPVVLSRKPEQARIELLLLIPVILLLAVPAGSLAALSVGSGYGTPLAVMTMFTAPRIYRFVVVLMRSHFGQPHMLYARACGIGTTRLLWVHLLSGVGPEVLALIGASLMMALGAIVPIEVVFDMSGVAQLAWTAALNRDAPVIAATTLLAVGAVALAGILTDSFNFTDFSRNCASKNFGLAPRMEESL
jgi:peptide/nickel transport system permease protein